MPKTRTSTGISGRFEPGMVTAFLNLARSNGVSMHEALRRVITQAILAGVIPGVERLDFASREREKWGEAATPTYDGENPVKSQGKRPDAPLAS